MSVCICGRRYIPARYPNGHCDIGQKYNKIQIELSEVHQRNLELKANEATKIDADWRHNTDCVSPEAAHEEMNKLENSNNELRIRIKHLREALKKCIEDRSIADCTARKALKKDGET